MKPFTIFAVLLVVACAKSDDSAAKSAAAPPQQATPAQPTAPDSVMEIHLNAIATLAPDSLKAVLPTHRQLTANLVASFNKEMKDMNMAPDAAWTALADSLRADLTAMPDMSAAALVTMMPQHRARIMRLIGMHREMMRKMHGR